MCVCVCVCVCAASKIYAPTSASLLIEPKVSDEWEADLVVKEGGGERQSAPAFLGGIKSRMTHHFTSYASSNQFVLSVWTAVS